MNCKEDKQDINYISPEVQIIVVEVEKGFVQSSRIDGVFEDNAEDDFWTN